MMEALKISFNDIPARCLASSASSENADYPHQNVLGGSKTLHWESAVAVTASNIVLDMGSGNTASIDHAIVSGLNAILALTPGTLNVYIQGSTDNFVGSTVTVFSKLSVVQADLIGTYGEELLFEGSSSTAFRYWRLRITTSNSVIHKIRKLGLGLYYDFDNRSPRFPYELGQSANPMDKGFMSDAGTMFVSSSGRAARSYNFSWNGISDDIREEFMAKIGQYLADWPLWFVEPVDFPHRIFPNRILYAWTTSPTYTSDQWSDNNFLQSTIREDILG